MSTAEADQQATPAAAQPPVLEMQLAQMIRDDRLALSLLAVAIAMQGGINARQLLADFDRLVEGNIAPEDRIPHAVADVRSGLVAVAKLLSKT